MRGVLTHEQKQFAFRLRGRGWRLTEIAREVGCTAPMVRLMVHDGLYTSGIPDEWEPRDRVPDGSMNVRRSWSGVVPASR